MKLAIDIEHEDPAYVEHRGGFPLLSHLRGAGERVEHRRAAIASAFDRFERAELDRAPDPEIGGLGMLVIQRSLLAAEDLGGLIHAFEGSDPWERLRTAKVPDLTAAYEQAVEQAETVLTGSFRLATEETVGKEAASSDERAVLSELRGMAIDRWTQMLERSARLWLGLHHVAKATMHGYPIIAGAHFEGPPAAGEIAEDIEPPRGRYAVAVTSRVAGTHITTDRRIILLDHQAVSGYRRDGTTAARLALELCEVQADGIMSRHAASVPLRGTRFLDSGSRAIAEQLGDRDRGAA